MNRFVKLSLLLVVVMALSAALPVLAQGGPIMYNSYNGDPAPRAFDELVVGMWNEQHPDQPVLHSIIAHEDFKQAIRAYLTAEPAPDLLTWFAGNRARFFIDRGLIAPITDMWEEAGYVDSYPPGFAAMSQVDGEYYFLPTSYYWWGIYYRPSLFESAGIESAPETWDDLLNACDVLSDAGLAPITIGTRYRWTWAGWFDYLNMRLNGPQFHLDLMLLKESYTDERVVAVFDAWRELFEHDCFVEDAAAYTWQEALDFMIQGDAAMYLIGDFVRDSFPDELEDDLDFFQFPIIDPMVPIGEDAPTDGYFIAANARNPEGARDLLEFFGSAEVQQLAFEEMGRLPTNTDVDISSASRFQQQGLAMLGTADLIVQFYDRDTTPPMADAGMDMFMAFAEDPMNADVMAMLDDLEAERIRLAEEEAAAE